MAEDTPFLNSLSKDKQGFVAKKAINPRPSYFSARLAEIRDSAGPDQATVGATVEISADFEALLILMPAKNRADLLYVLRELAVSMESSPELDLMNEIVAVRIDTYAQLTTDYASLTSVYDLTKQNIVELMVSLPNEEDTAAAKPSQTALGEDDPTVILVPDVGTLFNTTSLYLTELTKPEAMGVHDRIVDEKVLYAYITASQYRLSELSSWIEIINLYQAKV